MQTRPEKNDRISRRDVLDASSQVGISLLAVGEQHWLHRTLPLVQVRQREGLDQRPAWEQSLPHLTILLPQLQNNRDKCIQRSREQTMLGTPHDLVASPRLPSAHTERTTARAAKQSQEHDLAAFPSTVSGLHQVPPPLQPVPHTDHRLG